MDSDNYQGIQNRVVVTGLGVVSAIGQDIPTFWDSLVKGKSGVDYITSFDASAYPTRFAAEVKGFDAAAYVNRKQARHMDRFTQSRWRPAYRRYSPRS